jgi:hypothetical protein
MHVTPEKAEAALEDGFVTPSTTWWMRWWKCSAIPHAVKNPIAWVFYPISGKWRVSSGPEKTCFREMHAQMTRHGSGHKSGQKTGVLASSCLLSA